MHPGGVIYFDNTQELQNCCYCGERKLEGENLQCLNCKYIHEELPNLTNWVKVKYDIEGNAVPVNMEKYKKVIHLDVQRSFSDPNHFGHPLFKMSKFISMHS
jgi:hypothetical protein